MLLSVRGLHHTAGTKPLFQSLSVAISKGDKIGLNGHNGCGKSTLLKILAGSIIADEGELSRRSGLRLALVEQFVPEALLPVTLEAAVQQQLPEAERDSEGFRAALMLSRLGFRDNDLALEVRDLSGGQLNRLMLARALVTEPDLVLFDEPSNHMDLATLSLLERFLAEDINCAFLLVSHDRALLDAVTTRTLILRDERLYAFDMPFSAARQALTETDIAAAAARADEEKKIARLRASAKRLAVWGKVYDNEKLARKAKTMEKRVARLEQAKTFVSSGSGLALSLDARETRANRMLLVEDFVVSPPGASEVSLFHIDELVIRPGDRIALLGHNGCGKTSLITHLLGAYERAKQNGESGAHIRYSPQADVGYYDQNLEAVDGRDGKTLLEYLRQETRVQEATLRNSLINAGFPYADHDRAVRVLSGGERARLRFLALRLNRPNFLVMDEPTNHIDIEGREELEQQLAESGATLFMTSHDRRFIDNVATRFLLVEQGELKELMEPEVFYGAMAEADSFAEAAGYSGDAAPASGTAATAAAGAVLGEARDEDVLLERIVELEQLLAADQGRRPKFQKPKLQAAWREEIEALTQQLDGS